MSAAKVPCIRARMRQQEILALKLGGPTRTISRRAERARAAMSNPSVARVYRPTARPQTLWARASRMVQRIIQALAKIDAPGVTF